MKRGVLVTLVLSGAIVFSSILVSPSLAEEAGAKSEKQQKAEEQRRAREETERAAKRAEIEKRVRQELRQLEEWPIYLIPSGPNSGKIAIIKDVLTFSDMSVTSKYLSEKEFGISNYALSANEDGMGVWETMQRNADGDIAFWKGEVKDKNMRGVLGLQPKKGQMQEFSFTTEKPAEYIEPAPKKEDTKSKKDESVKDKGEGKVSTKTKD